MCSLRLMLTGGGTGGHIYPALAVAEEVRGLCPGAEMLYVGTAHGLEADLVPQSGLAFATVAARGAVGKSPVEAAGALLSAGRGLLTARRLVQKFRPDAVLGTGGYVSGPVGAAALLAGVPLALQEQNVVPGVTNRLLSRRAALVFVPFAAARRHFPPRVRLLVAGNPVRRAVLEADRDRARAAWGFADDELVALVFGGSQGARALNEAVVAAWPALAGRPGLRLLHVTGTQQAEPVARLYQQSGITTAGDGNIMVRDYLYDMPSALAAADLVVARAGAMTLAELTGRGLPSILVPLPHATHGHQEENARALAEAGAAVVLPDRRLGGQTLAETVLSLIDDSDRRARMAAAARRLGRPDAARFIARRLLALAGHT